MHLELPCAGGDRHVEIAIGIGKSDHQQAVGGLHRNHHPGQSDAGIAGINHIAGDAGRGVDECQIGGDGLAGGQRKQRRRAQIGGIITLESHRHISSRRQLGGVAARIVRHHARQWIA